MNRCAIVTGGARGIGKSVAEALSQEGYNIVVADMNDIEGRSVAEDTRGYFVKVDLAERESCRHLIDEAVKEFGRIDILVNNAGFQHVSPLEEFPEDTWDKMIGVMLTAPFRLTKYAWPYMKEQGWGRIVNIASTLSLVSSPYKVGYASAKHGLVGLTRTAALEGGGFGITVNAICPSYVRTSLVEDQIQDQATTHKIDESEVIEKILLKSTTIKRLIEPSEVASLVLYLCSDKGSAITGSCLTIDCGLTAQ